VPPISRLIIAIKYLNNSKSGPEEQPGVFVAFQIVFHVTKVEANKTKKKRVAERPTLIMI
jgi:hypothetical protein